MKNILIYADNGTDPICVQQTMQSLQIALPNISIQPVNAVYLNNTQWPAVIDLIVFPGGRSLPYYQSLAGGGNQKIIEFVQAGGNYLGICAGAYYACAQTEFEKNFPLEVCCTGILNFFPGIARGSAYGNGKFQYENYQGAQLTKIIDKKNRQYDFYFNGGAQFVEAEKYSDVNIIACYADLPEQPAAIIQCQVGKGRAILSGVHLEYAYHALPADNKNIYLLRQQLHSAEIKRQQFFTDLIKSYPS